MSAQSFEVIGGSPLAGTLVPQGAKNEVLQILCATLLTEEEVIIDNVPNILDVQNLLNLLRGLGVKVKQLSNNTYSFCASDIDLAYFNSDQYTKDSKNIRGSVMLIGPLLSRYKRAFLPKPGGDKIGRRRLDTHFRGFEAIGAEFKFDSQNLQYFIEAENLKGGYVLMEEISLTGTANMIMAAVMAQGNTTIYNAACEPYIQQLCKMLISMGAKIEGLGSNLLTITGVTRLTGTRHLVMPDMIEIGSFIGLAAMTGSEITIKDAYSADLGIIPSVFSKLGVNMEKRDNDLFVPAQDHYEISTFIDGSILTVYDSPWPGFTPDLMSIILVVAIQAKGTLLLHQKMFESRLFFVDKLIDMGAKIILCDPHRATVIGLDNKTKLRGIQMTSPDIRAGVALLIAALSAEGKSVIHQVQQIDRGYQNIDERLNAIGANIKRIIID